MVGEARAQPVQEIVARSAPMGRFEALDSLRGLCALLVANFHLAIVSQGKHWAFTLNGWLFVDFFFVLSGLVIAASYGEKLANKFSIRRFMALRFGRIYPLHFVMLLPLVAKQCLNFYLASSGHAEQAFGDGRSVDSLVGSLVFVHIFGLWSGLVWNAPSWSIAAEMWAYLIFALVCKASGQRFVAVMFALSIAAAAWIAFTGDPWLNRTFAGSLPRCLFGFGLGVLAWRIISKSKARTIPFVTASLVEILVTIACVAFVQSAHGPLTLFAPILFVVTVLVFAREGGLISRLLKLHVFRFVGKLSYSIYMAQFVLLSQLSPLLGRLARFGGPDILVPLVFLGALIGLAWLSWRFVEDPGRKWSRTYAATMR